MNKTWLIIAALAATGVALTACATGEDFDTASSTSAAATSAAGEAAVEGQTVSIEDNRGTQTVPVNPDPVAVLDNRSFEILNEWGVSIDAAPVQLVPFTVPEYREDKNIVDIGNHREPNLEALTAVEPQVIVSGQRFSQYDEDITKLDPDAVLVDLEPREDKPLDEELRRHALGLGKIFGKETEAQALVADFDAALKRARDAYNGKDTVMAVNVSGGTIGYIAPSVGRTFGPLFDLLSLKPAVEIDGGSNNHQGDDVSVEAIAQANPDRLLVLDRDAGTNSREESDYVAAKQVISDNEALAKVSAVTNNHVYYAPEDTYTNESIITYTEILNALADQFEQA